MTQQAVAESVTTSLDVAPVTRRLLAIAVDLLIVVGVALVVTWLAPGGGVGGFAVVLFVAKAASAGVLGGLSGIGHSPGQYVAGVETRRSSDGERIGWWAGVVRYLVYPFFVVAVVVAAGFGRTLSMGAVVTRRMGRD